jgi:hypothetical protein
MPKHAAKKFAHGQRVTVSVHPRKKGKPFGRPFQKKAAPSRLARAFAAK